MQDGPMIDSVTTVADIQTVLHRMLYRSEAIQSEIISSASGVEQQLASIRMDVRNLQLASSPSSHTEKLDLIDSKTLSPAVFSGARSENFKAWAKKIKAYTNAKLPGYRQALDLTEKLGKDKAVDAGVRTSWGWPEADKADARFHDMLLMITAREAAGVVESVPSCGF